MIITAHSAAVNLVITCLGLTSRDTKCWFIYTSPKTYKLYSVRCNERNAIYVDKTYYDEII